MGEGVEMWETFRWGLIKKARIGGMRNEQTVGSIIREQKDETIIEHVQFRKARKPKHTTCLPVNICHIDRAGEN